MSGRVLKPRTVAAGHDEIQLPLVLHVERRDRKPVRPDDDEREFAGLVRRERRGTAWHERIAGRCGNEAGRSDVERGSGVPLSAFLSVLAGATRTPGVSVPAHHTSLKTRASTATKPHKRAAVSIRDPSRRRYNGHHPLR
jgi:hypothetical protein